MESGQYSTRVSYNLDDPVFTTAHVPTHVEQNLIRNIYVISTKDNNNTQYLVENKSNHNLAIYLCWPIYG